MPRFAARTAGLDNPGARAWEIHRAAMRRRRQGEPVIVLSIGEHDEPAAAGIVAATEASLRAGRHHYSPGAGEPELRRAMARFRHQALGDPRGPGQVVITPGGQSALFATLQCVLEPGTDILVPEPMYATYESTIALSGARPVRVALRPEADFRLRAEDVAAAVTPRSRALLLNTPHNPSGTVVDRATLEALGALCRQHDLWLISDEVYATLVHDGEFVTPAALPELAERVVSLFSLSKGWAMTGWRIGSVSGPPDFIGRVSEILGCMQFGVAPFVQDAATRALDRGHDEIRRLRDLYRRRRDRVCALLGQVPGLRVRPPAAGMFVLLDIRKLGLGSEDFCWRLFEHHGVSLLPAEAFGPSGAGHVRLSLTAPEDQLVEACRRVGVFVSEA